MAMVAPAVAARAGAGKAAASKATSSKAGGKAGGRARAGASGSAASPAGGTPPTQDQQQTQGQQMARDLFDRSKPGQVAKAGAQVSGELGDAARSLTLTPPRRLTAKDASGFAFGLIAYAVVLSGIKYGPAGVRGWIAAKFVNKPMTRQGQPS